MAVIENGEVTELREGSYPTSASFDLHSFNPTVDFQFKEGSQVGVMNIPQIYVGTIKSYDDRADALEGGSLFNDINFNEDTVLMLEDDGLSYIVAEVKFNNGASRIYASAFDNDPFGSKSTYRNILETDMEGNDWKVAETSSVELEPDDIYMVVVQSVVCKVSDNFGFQVCNVGEGSPDQDSAEDGDSSEDENSNNGDE